MVIRIVLVKKSRKRSFDFGLRFCKSASFSLWVNRTKGFCVRQNVAAHSWLPVGIRDGSLWILAAINEVHRVLGLLHALLLSKKCLHGFRRETCRRGSSDRLRLRRMLLLTEDLCECMRRFLGLADYMVSHVLVARRCRTGLLAECRTCSQEYRHS